MAGTVTVGQPFFANDDLTAAGRHAGLSWSFANEMYLATALDYKKLTTFCFFRVTDRIHPGHSPDIIVIRVQACAPGLIAYLLYLTRRIVFVRKPVSAREPGDWEGNGFIGVSAEVLLAEDCNFSVVTLASGEI
jgi:hypothetical protein